MKHGKINKSLKQFDKYRERKKQRVWKEVVTIFLTNAFLRHSVETSNYHP